MTKVLFVCLGNICRSPTAHGVFAAMVKQKGLKKSIQVDSAGTSGWHQGDKPDARSVEEAALRGYDLSSIRSRQVSDSDFVEQDYILAMDNANLAELYKFCPGKDQHKIALFLDFVPELTNKEVPDPYYGGAEGFAHVLDIVEQGAEKLLDHIQSNA